MNKAEKTATIEELKDQFSNTSYFYLTDVTSMSVAQVNNFRRLCFQKGIKVEMIKNTLIKKAFEGAPAERNYDQVLELLHGPTVVMFADVANLPAKTLKEFRGSNDRPVLKGAYIDAAVFSGDDQLDVLVKLKTKEELIGEVIGMLQSPASSVIGALQSGGQKIMGLLKTLEDRGA
ncbi:MAG: 50S ribosomal protein L10 [Saprospiraceae bacterium]|jgi:large subunit ribosomal protein L10